MGEDGKDTTSVMSMFRLFWALTLESPHEGIDSSRALVQAIEGYILRSMDQCFI